MPLGEDKFIRRCRRESATCHCAENRYVDNVTRLVCENAFESFGIESYNNKIF